jgi:hypothetical protein
MGEYQRKRRDPLETVLWLLLAIGAAGIVSCFMFGCGQMAVESAGLPALRAVWPDVRAELVETEAAAGMDEAIKMGEPAVIAAEWEKVYPLVLIGINVQEISENVRAAKLERARRFDALVKRMRGGDLLW